MTKLLNQWIRVSIFYIYVSFQSFTSQPCSAKNCLPLMHIVFECTVCLSGEVCCSCQTKGNMHLLSVDQYNNLTLSNQSIFLCTGAHCKNKANTTEERREGGEAEGGRAEANKLTVFFLIGRAGKYEVFLWHCLSNQPGGENDTAKKFLCVSRNQTSVGMHFGGNRGDNRKIQLQSVFFCLILYSRGDSGAWRD